MILFRYLAKEILISMFAVSFSLLTIVMSARFVKYLAQAAAGDLAPDVVLLIMMYRIPGFLELVLPLGLFIGILLAYGRLYVESEMTVISACGLSTRRVALYTFFPSMLVALVVAFMSFYASPVGLAKSKQMFQEARNTSGLEAIIAGRFRTDEKSGRVSYVQELSGDRSTMKNVFSAQPSGDGKSGELSVVFAQSGKIQMADDGESRYLVLNNGLQYSGRPGTKNFRVSEFETYGQLIKDQRSEKNRYQEVDTRSTMQLINSKRLDDQAALQWRISLVILVPVLGLIAQALSKTDHRRGRYVKMLPAFIVYISYILLLNAARDAIEKGSLPVTLGMWWVHGLFLMLAMLLLYGSDTWRYLRNRESSYTIG